MLLYQFFLSKQRWDCSSATTTANTLLTKLTISALRNISMTTTVDRLNPFF